MVAAVSYTHLITARIVLKKVDAETGAPAAQGDATLDGAVYQASFERGGETETVEGTTAGGSIVFDDLPLGEVEIREVSPSDGYLPDRKVHRIEVTAEMAQAGDAVIEVSPEGEFGELVQRGGLIIGKGDAERYEHEDGTFWNYAQGDATFEGAEFTLYNRSDAAVWYDGNGDGELQDGEMVDPDGVVAVLSTCLLYTSLDHRVLQPLLGRRSQVQPHRHGHHPEQRLHARPRGGPEHGPQLRLHPPSQAVTPRQARLDRAARHERPGGVLHRRVGQGW